MANTQTTTSIHPVAFEDLNEYYDLSDWIYAESLRYDGDAVEDMLIEWELEEREAEELAEARLLDRFEQAWADYD